MAVIQNCSVASTRKKINHARYSVLKDENGAILNKMVALRHEIAQKLGYATWADYKIEPKMARDAKTAISFMQDLSDGLQPKFDAEVNRLRQLKVAETGDAAAQINWWDFRYYQNKMMLDDYGVDSSELRNYFPLNEVLDGMFGVYEHIFGLEFIEIEPGYKWINDLRLFIVQDTQTREPLGAFYLDLFPREGKYNHFAQFDIVSGKRQRNGCYQRPVVALVCNFTPGLEGEPALMNHGEVETIFHEFGHAMHSILTRANFSTLSGANVARDFVEAPSQMFEAWAWDPVILKRFAYDWRNPSQSIPEETLKAMKAANLATKGIHYRRQIGLALADLQIHNGPVTDAGAVCNQANSKVLFATPKGTNFAATFGHLTGYDAGYYGYAWADAIAADMATVFEKAPDRFLDQGVGRRLRDEIYSVGGTKPAAEAVRAFLGRERSIEAFLKTIGL
jgi:thimet oligopeptidase